MAESPIIEVQNITKRFKGLTAVKDVSFSIREGGITGMIGPNGAGKSTFIIQHSSAMVLQLTQS